MRRRLLRSTLGAVAVAVLLLGGPLAVAVQSLLTDQAVGSQVREAEQIQAVLDREADSLPGAEVLVEVIGAQTGARLTLLDPAGRVVLDTSGAPAGAVVESPDVARAVEGGVGEVVEDGVVAVSVPVRVRGSDLILRMARPDTDLRREIRGAWLAIAALALTALGAAAFVARRQGDRLARPLEDLATSASRLGDGDFTARAPRSGLPEPDEVAAALDSTAGRLGAMVERSRSFSADASHQLRTPLTALRLDLEALEAVSDDPEVSELVAAASGEADRLQTTIEELLALAGPPAGPAMVDIGQVVSSRIEAWQALARADGRRIVVQAVPAPPVRARAAAVGQALQVLLDNALTHGNGTITVVVQPVDAPARAAHGGEDAGQGGRGVRLCVADEGPGVPAEREADLFAGTGRGLPLARSLVEAEGGRLRLDRARPSPVFCLLLPAGRRPEGR